MGGAGPMTVLVVEDEDDLADALEELLKLDGHRSVRARDGVHALEILRFLKPDLILLDMNMPRLDGFGVLEQLASEGKRHPIIAMSAFAAFLPEALKRGATAALPKPFELKELRDAVAAVGQGQPGVKPVAHPERLNSLELARIERLYCMRVMERETDAALDTLARVAADLLRAPIGFISIITEDRQWWKGMYGMTGELAVARGTPIEQSFCSHAVAARSPLVVGDARKHPFFRDNTLVTSGLFTSYAGVPIVIPGVGALGTVCVLDTEPRVFTTADLELLGLLADRVAGELEWRERGQMGDRPLGTFKYLALMDERHNIYNATTFAKLLGALARVALVEDAPMVAMAFERPAVPGRGWPYVEQEAGTAALVSAIRQVATVGVAIGRLDDRSIAVLCPGARVESATSLVSAVMTDDAQLRRADAKLRELPAPVGAATVVRGALSGERAIAELRRQLDEALGGSARSKR